MPAKDIYHETVRNALIKSGWVITHDPYTLKFGARDLYIDLGAEQLLAAEQNGKQIAVEIKSFVSPSEIDDLKNALGQFILYEDILVKTDPQRTLYLAVRNSIFLSLFEEPIGKMLLDNDRLRLVVFDEQEEEIVTWIP